MNMLYLFCVSSPNWDARCCFCWFHCLRRVVFILLLSTCRLDGLKYKNKIIFLSKLWEKKNVIQTNEYFIFWFQYQTWKHSSWTCTLYVMYCTHQILLTLHFALHIFTVYIFERLLEIEWPLPWPFPLPPPLLCCDNRCSLLWRHRLQNYDVIECKCSFELWLYVWRHKVFVVGHFEGCHYIALEDWIQ